MISTVKRIESLDLFDKLREKLPNEQKSFLQSSEYAKLQEGLGNEIWALERNGKAWLFILFRAKRGTFWFCPYGIFEKEEIKDVVEFLKVEGEKLGVVFIRISPLQDKSEENDKLFWEIGFKEAPVHLMHPELMWVLDLNKSEEELMKEMRKNTRYYVRKAEKDGVEIVSGKSQELFDEFYKIHEDTVKRQKFVPYSKRYLDEELKVFGERDEILVFGAKYKGRMIAAAVIVFYGQEAVYHQGASMTEFNKIPASYLIQWEAIKEAKRRGKAVYNFWGVVENAPKHPWAGLSFFKQGFGGKGRYLTHVKDLPIKKFRYSLNVAVELFRKWQRGY